MNREDILAKSRKENSGQDERELQEAMRAGRISMSFGGAICFIMVLLKTLINDAEAMDIVTYTCFCVYGGMGFFQYLWQAIRVKKSSYWIVSVIFGIFFILAGVLFVMELLRWKVS